MLGSTRQDLPSDSPAACRSACRRKRASLPAGSHQRTILAHPAYPGRPRGRAGHCPTTSHDDGQVQTDASAGPAPPAPASSARLPTHADDEPGRTQRATTPTPAIPAIRRPAHAALQDLTSAGHSARGKAQTPDADTGRLTADTWTLRRPHRTLDSGPVDRQAWTLIARTGHRTPDTGHRTPDTGHRTPDTGRGRGQGHEAAAGIRTSWATTPSDRTLERPTVFL
jgi:hypothetical protein